MRKNVRAIAAVAVSAAIITAVFLFKGGKIDSKENSPAPTESTAPAVVQSETPSAAETPTALPSPGNEPGTLPGVRTDYEAFSPNEAGEIPVVMFHKLIEAYEPNTEKDFTTTFGEFETLLQTLYDQDYRLISMKDFIDCNISVPAGKKPMVFTFDDGTAGQFNLIKENGAYKANPKSAIGIMSAFNEKHPDFGLKGIFYVNMDVGDNIFKGEGSVKERFEFLENLGFELGSHTWGHVDYKDPVIAGKIEETLGKNQIKAEEILPGLRFYSLALPYGSRPADESRWPLLADGSYNGTEYHNEAVMAVGAAPSVPSISTKYNALYVRRIRAQGRVTVEADLTWWLPKMTKGRMFVSDGDPQTIVVPKDKTGMVNEKLLGGKKLIAY
jgi:peptidoglycan/xylan/chitin deacetylase (PgdA/CDA1 family)